MAKSFLRLCEEGCVHVSIDRIRDRMQSRADLEKLHRSDDVEETRKKEVVTPVNADLGR
jgi:hypothetical protein